jgi:hypothetical protein
MDSRLRGNDEDITFEVVMHSMSTGLNLS